MPFMQQRNDAVIPWHFRALVACPGLVWFAVGAEIILASPSGAFPLCTGSFVHFSSLGMSSGTSAPLICSPGKWLRGSVEVPGCRYSAVVTEQELPRCAQQTKSAQGASAGLSSHPCPLPGPTSVLPLQCSPLLNDLLDTKEG